MILIADNTMTQQKFPIGTKVVIADIVQQYPYLVTNHKAIVECTYAQAYGGNDYQSYQLYIPILNQSFFWYPEEYLSLAPDEGADTEEHF